MKKIAVIFILMLCMPLIASCSNDSNSTPSPDKNKTVYIPEMHISYTLDGAVDTVVPIEAGNASWTYDNGDGTRTAVEQDSLHPLDAVGKMPEIEKTSDLKSIEITFTSTPI